MKHGKVNNTDSDFPWWVLPDKPQIERYKGTIGGQPVIGGGKILEPNWHAVNDQQERFRELLGRSCKGEWMETNNRYFFKLEEDYEMFLIMLNLVA